MRNEVVAVVQLIIGVFEDGRVPRQGLLLVKAHTCTWTQMCSECDSPPVDNGVKPEVGIISSTDKGLTTKKVFRPGCMLNQLTIKVCIVSSTLHEGSTADPSRSLSAVPKFAGEL